MPPRTGPRRKKRIKQAPATLRRLAIICDDTSGAGYSVRTELATAHRIELDNNGHLILRDEHDTIVRIIAAGEWREVRPATVGDLPVPLDTAGLPEETEKPEPRIVEFDTVLAREQARPEPLASRSEAKAAAERATLTNENDPVIPPEPDARFVPSSPEEAQRILMEMNRRLQDPDAPPPPPPRPKE